MDSMRHITLSLLFATFFFNFVDSQACVFPASLLGTWTSTNLGNVIITEQNLTFSKTVSSQTVAENTLECRIKSGSKYILGSTQTFSDPFGGSSAGYMWMCIEFKSISDFTYIFYLYSASEPAFDHYRLKFSTSPTETESSVCTDNPDVAEFHTMVKAGQGTEASDAVVCPDLLLGTFTIQYVTSSACASVSTSTVTSCGQNAYTKLAVTTPDCSEKEPFYTDDGLLGCIATVYDAADDVHYVSLYNFDTMPTTQFVCLAVQLGLNDTVYISSSPTDCVANQTPTETRTSGARATLAINETCIPTTTTSTTTISTTTVVTNTQNTSTTNAPAATPNLVWLYILLPVLAVLLVAMVIVCLVYKCLKRKHRATFGNGDIDYSKRHPLEESSMTLNTALRLKKTTHGQQLEGIEEVSQELDYNDNTATSVSPTHSSVKPRDIDIQVPPVKVIPQELTQGSRPVSRTSIATQTNSKLAKIKTLARLKASLTTKKPGIVEENGHLRRGKTDLKLSTSKLDMMPSKKTAASAFKSRLGTIDNLVLARKPDNRLRHLNTPKSNTFVVPASVPEKVVNPEVPMSAFPEEYTVDIPDETLPELTSKPEPVPPGKPPTITSIKQPTASRKAWR